MLSRRQSKASEEGCFGPSVIQLPKLPTRPFTRARTPAREGSAHRRRSSAGVTRRSSLVRPQNAGDTSLIEAVVAERRQIDISQFSAADRKSQFPFPLRPTRIQTVAEPPKAKDRSTPSIETELKKGQTDAPRVIRAMNWVPLRLDNFFPSREEDHAYRGQAKTLFVGNSGESRWVAAEVLGYSAETGTFDIRLTEGRPGLHKSVHRVNLMLRGESDTFPPLLSQAHSLKVLAEKRLNTDIFIAEKMSKEFELSGSPEQFMKKIGAFIGNMWKSASETTRKRLEAEINGFYDYAYLKGVLYYRWDEVDFLPIRARENLVDQPNYYRLEHKEKVIRTDVEAKVKRLKSVSLYAQPMTFRLLENLRMQFRGIADSDTVFQYPPSPSSWFQFSNSRGSHTLPPLTTPPLSLATFFKFQKFRLQQCKSYISKAWIHTAACAVIDSYPAALHERVSKCVELMSQELIWSQVIDTLTAIKQFWGKEDSLFAIDVEYKHDGRSGKLDVELRPGEKRIREIVEYYLTLVTQLKDDVPRICSWSQCVDSYQHRDSTIEETTLSSHLLSLLDTDLLKIQQVATHIQTYQYIAQLLIPPSDDMETVSPQGVLTTIGRLETYMTELSQAQKHVLSTLKASYPAGIFLIDSSHLRLFLLEILKKSIEEGQLRLHQVLSTFGEYVDGVCLRLVAQLQIEVTTIDELIECMSNAQRIKKSDFPKVKGEVEQLTKGLAICRWVWCHPQNANSSAILELYRKISHLEALIESRMEALERDKPKYMRKLEQERETLKASVKALYHRYQEFIQIPINQKEDLEKWMGASAEFAKSILSQIKEVQRTREKINHRESVLNLDPSKQYLLDKLISSSPIVLDFALQSCEVYNDMQVWKNTQLKKIDLGKVKEVLVKKKAEFFSALPKITSSQQQVATTLCHEFDEFLSYTEVASLLQSDSLKERHWKQICEVLRLPNDVYLDIGAVVGKEGHISPKSEVIASVVQTADRELKIEIALKEMKSKFFDMTFVLEPASNTFVLLQENDIRQSIMEFRGVMQAINENYCIQEFKLQATDWTKKLDTLELLLDEWGKAQGELLRLADFFEHSEKQLEEAEVFAEFRNLTGRVNKILVEIQEQPQVLRCRDMHIKYFQSCAQQLHACSVKLAQSREDDSQFFALSDSQMMQLLGAVDMY